jgi:hypothetical protein
MAIGNPCAVMQALVNWEMQAIRMLNKKFAALQRLAQLIEQFGDINTLIPNLNRLLGTLVPVDALNLDIFSVLQTACPFLGLPPYSNADLNELKSKLQTAYSRLLGDIANHPWMRLDRLQEQLNDFQNKINYPYGADYLRCMNAVCGALDAAGSLYSGLANANISKELALFSKNFVQGAGEVLTEPMKLKRNEAMNVYNAVSDLRSDTVQDFQTLTKTGTVVPASPPLKLGTPTGADYTFDSSSLAAQSFPPTIP